MSSWSSTFPHSADFTPEGDFETFAKSIPARWAVYLFCDEADRPIQLLCVKNLRNSVKGRLGIEEAPTSSRRVNYRGLVRRVYWQRVDNSLESDWVYLEAARACFPAAYAKMTGFRPAWFLHIDADAEFPKYTKTTDLTLTSGQYFGPMEDKTSAARLTEMLEDAFDLCRYYNILVQSPNGKACAYKEMGKCPAPCDGSVSIEQYRRMIEMSLRAMTDPADLIREHTARMKSAAGALRFETAGKIKQYIDDLAAMSRGPFRFVTRWQEMAYVSIQRGPTANSAAVFLIMPGAIEPIATAFNDAGISAELYATILRRAERVPAGPIDRAGQERLAVVAAHLFSPKNSRGVFIRLSELNEKSLIAAYRELMKQAPADSETEGEGIMKELQAELP